MSRATWNRLLLNNRVQKSFKDPSPSFLTDFDTGRAVIAEICNLVLTMRYSSSDFPRGTLNDGKCRLVINEFNTFPNGINQFVEFAKICEIHYKEERICPVTMRFYKLVFISHDGYLVGSCKLKNKAKKTKTGAVIYTVSAKATSENNLNIEECNFASDFEDYTPGRFPVGSSAPFAMALLYSQDEAKGILDGVDVISQPTNIYQKATIDMAMEKKIVQNLVDLIVYSSSSPFTTCDYFKKYFSGNPVAGKTILRDWGQLEEPYEWSLSRCRPNSVPIRTEFMPFQSALFVYTPRTPGLENLCEKGKHFAIEDHLQTRSVALVRFIPPYQCLITTQETDRISSPTFFFEKFKQVINADRANDEPEAAVETLSPEAQILDLNLALDPIPFRRQPVSEEEFQHYLENESPLIWNTCDQFKPTELITTLKGMKNPPMKWDQIMSEDVCFWFEWLASNRFRCKLCNALLRQGLFVERDTSRLITKIMTIGQINHGPQAKYLNSEIIKNHISNPLHKIAVDYATLFQSGYRGEDLQKEYERPGGYLRNHTKQTERLIFATYVFNLVDTTFERQPILREMLDNFNVSTGKVHRNPMGHQKIMMSISSTLHKSLVAHLNKNQPSFSLLIDASTDVAALSGLAVIFQTYDQNKNLRVYFYKIIWLNSGEGGEDIYRKMYEEFRADGLWEYVRSKCVGFASDGGSNVKKVKGLLEKELDHPLFSVHCHAHKTELVIKHAWEDVPILLYIEDSVNTLHRVFASRSAKKKQHLTNAQTELSDRSFTLKRLRKTRWINGRLRALEKIVLHWKTIVLALQNVIEDRTIRDRRQQLKAKEMMRDMKDPVYVATTAFVADCYTALSSMSLKLQDRGVTLIGKKLKREKLKETLIRLKSEDGPFLRKILSNLQLPNEELGGTPVAVQMFETQDTRLDGIAMISTADREMDNALYKNRERYIQLILNQIESYFPTDASDDMDIFDPQQWSMEHISDYGNTRLRNMNNKLKWNWNEGSLIDAWRALKASVSHHSDFNLKRSQLTPEDFWTYFLNLEDIQWSDIMRTTITNVIVLPASTAEVERVFSHYTRTKTFRRFNLQVATVDALVRLQLNGPKNISEFDSFKYAKEFLKTYSRSDDASVATSRKRRRSEGAHFTSHFFDEDNSEIPSGLESSDKCADDQQYVPIDVNGDTTATAIAEAELLDFEDPYRENDSEEDNDYSLRLEVAEILASLSVASTADDRREL